MLIQTTCAFLLAWLCSCLSPGFFACLLYCNLAVSLRLIAYMLVCRHMGMLVCPFASSLAWLSAYVFACLSAYVFACLSTRFFACLLVLCSFASLRWNWNDLFFVVRKFSVSLLGVSYLNPLHKLFLLFLLFLLLLYLFLLLCLLLILLLVPLFLLLLSPPSPPVLEVTSPRFVMNIIRIKIGFITSYFQTNAILGRLILQNTI